MIEGWRECDWAGELTPMGSEDYDDPKRRRCTHPTLGRLVTRFICHLCPDPALVEALRASDKPLKGAWALNIVGARHASKLNNAALALVPEKEAGDADDEG